MAIAPDGFISVPEAARRLHVSVSTMWRWINAQQLPAYRVGPKRVLIKEADLPALVAPRDVQAQETARRVTRPEEQPLTDEERARGLAAIAAARRGQVELLKRTGGKLFRSSGDVINEMRDERSGGLD